MTVSSPSLLVGQSGGATAVINASLVGVIDAATESGHYGRILGASNGIEGLLTESFVDLTDLSTTTRSTLRRTPSAALGTGRYKMKEGDLERALDLMAQYQITGFVYIGGNDSADTAHQLAERAIERGQDLLVASVPKTIDNDLPETDHCPGYGSIARYLANAVRDATYDSIASPQLHAVKFVEVMGRDAGWVAASGALGFGPDERELEPLLLLPERPPADAEAVLALVERDLSTRGWSVVVVPETLRTADGKHLGGDQPEYVDGFGHPYFPSTGAALTRMVTQNLGVRARYDKPGTAARMSISLASEVDLQEAWELGAGAVTRLLDGKTSFITVLRRTSESPYHCVVDDVPVELIANRVRHLPDAFISPSGTAITEQFRRYAMPLLGKDPFPGYVRISPQRQKAS